MSGADEVIALVHERDRLLARIAEIEATLGGLCSTPTQAASGPRRRGAPFKGGSVKRMPQGKFRYVFKHRGRDFWGPLVPTFEEAEAGRVAAVASVLAATDTADPPVPEAPVHAGDENIPTPVTDGKVSFSTTNIPRNIPARDAPCLPGPGSPPPAPPALCPATSSTAIDGGPIRTGDAFVVSEDFEEEDGTAWITDDVWVVRAPTGVEVDGCRQWSLERVGDGAEGVGFPALHPFTRRAPERAPWDVQLVGMSHGALAEDAH